MIRYSFKRTSSLLEDHRIAIVENTRIEIGENYVFSSEGKRFTRLYIDIHLTYVRGYVDDWIRILSECT